LAVTSSAAKTATTTATFITASGARHALNLRVADNFWLRLRGLMFSHPQAPNSALLFERCTSVHTCFMRYALDLVYLDIQGRITQCVPGLKPWRFHWAQAGSQPEGVKPVHTLELQPGALQRLGLAPGDQLHQQ
jgi:uncharacterized protein